MLEINREIIELSEYIINMRRYLHMHPEMGLEEYNTSKTIKNELDKMKVAYTSTAKTGIKATIGNGNGMHIALRADMDAIRVQEKTQVEYASVNDGIMHACGHDGHMAALLGAIKVLKKYEDEIDGTIDFIFQPSEENCKGAKMIIEEGNLEGVQEIFGVHIFTDIDYGKISIEEGPRMAQSDMFKIHVKGKGGHAGKPHQCIDAALVCSAIVMNLQSIVSREINPIDSAVVTVGKIETGTQHNIIAQEGIICGTVRTFSSKVAKEIQNSIERIVYLTAESYRAQASVEYELSAHPVVINDRNVVNRALNGARKVFNEKNLVSIRKIMLGEDFSSYQERIPGAFAFIGGGNSDIGCIFPNHSEKFNMDERAILDASKLYVAYALEAVGRSK